MTKVTSYDLAQKHGMLNESEIDLIKEHVARLSKKPVIINIGAGLGTGELAMLEIKPDAFIYSVDPQPRREAMNYITDAGHQGQVVRLLARSQDIKWPKLKVNAVFVDGGHTEDDVRQDIAIYKPMVKKGGLMFFHDYGHPNYAPDHLMSNAIDELMSDWKQLGIARYLVAFKNE